MPATAALRSAEGPLHEPGWRISARVAREPWQRGRWSRAAHRRGAHGSSSPSTCSRCSGDRREKASRCTCSIWSGAPSAAGSGSARQPARPRSAPGSVVLERPGALWLGVRLLSGSRPSNRSRNPTVSPRIAAPGAGRAARHTPACGTAQANASRTVPAQRPRTARSPARPQVGSSCPSAAMSERRSMSEWRRQPAPQPLSSLRCSRGPSTTTSPRTCPCAAATDRASATSAPPWSAAGTTASPMSQWPCLGLLAAPAGAATDRAPARRRRRCDRPGPDGCRPTRGRPA